MTSETSGNSNPAVAVTGSPNNANEISIDVRSGFLNTPLQGALVEFKVPQRDVQTGDMETIAVVGQVGSLETENRWHEDPGLKNFVKMRGQLPNLTEVGDVTSGTMQVLGAYRHTGDGPNGTRWEKTRLSVPVGSGRDVFLADAASVRQFMAHEENYAYLGWFYGTGNVPAPVRIRHFGSWENGGAGEALMGGVFGPSGCGKSVLAASLDALWAQHPDMGLLILDPASEFARNSFGRGQGLDFDFHDVLRRCSGRRFEPGRDVISISEIQLGGITLFVDILDRQRFFTRGIGLGSAKIKEAKEEVIEALQRLYEDNNFAWREGWQFARMRQDQADSIRQAVVDACSRAYAVRSRNDKYDEFLDAWNNRVDGIWDRAAELFARQDRNGNQRYAMNDLVREVMTQGRKLIINLHPGELQLGEEMKLQIMEFVFRRISQASHQDYQNENGDNTNCMIVLDEAGRFIPRSAPNDDTKRFSDYITNKVKELRKYRVGFQFITQTINEIQKDIFTQLHYRIYGVGMAVGADARDIENREGKQAFEMYETLPDPRLSNIFSFMVCGAILALGTSGRPMYIQGFEGGRELVQQNADLLPQASPEADDGDGTTGAQEATDPAPAAVAEDDIVEDPFGAA